VLIVLLLIACGWTITFQNLHEKDNHIIIGAIGFLIITTLGWLSKFQDGESHKFHDFSGLSGVVMFIIRIATYGLFMAQVFKTEKLVPRKSQVFFNQFKLGGTLFILGWPIMYLLTWFVAPYLRHRMFIFGHWAIQIVACAILLKQLTGRETGYKKASRTQPELGGLGAGF
jgi:uncharacterized protein YacL